MMRRYVKILLAFMLSLMVTCLVAGTSNVPCANLNKVKTAHMSNTVKMPKASNEKSFCLADSVAKFSPTGIPHSFVFNFSDSFSVVALFDRVMVYFSLPQKVETFIRYIVGSF
ncbi:MAG: hypothetical protein KA955_00615 [Prevotella sp.]|nr:hypothetical protein [Prevotella sp.]